jgi:hypothetical protein
MRRTLRSNALRASGRRGTCRHFQEFSSIHISSSEFRKLLHGPYLEIRPAVLAEGSCKYCLESHSTSSSMPFPLSGTVACQLGVALPDSIARSVGGVTPVARPGLDQS